MQFCFNEKKTAQAAAHVLKLAGGTLNYMKLVKLLFLADRQALVENEQPITGADMVSMKCGPVLSEVLDLIKKGDHGAWAEYVSPPLAYEVSLKCPKPDTDELSRYELRVLDAIYAKFGPAGEWDLVKWLHKHIPEWRDPGGSVLAIEFDAVLRAQHVSEEDIQRISKDAEAHYVFRALCR